MASQQRSGRVVLWALAAAGSVAAGLQSFAPLAQLADWFAIMNALGAWLVISGSYLCASFFAQRGLARGFSAVLMALVFSVAAALASVFTPAALVLNDGVRIAQIVFYVLAAVLAGISCIFAVRNYHVDVGEASPRHEIAKISILWAGMAFLGAIFHVATTVYLITTSQIDWQPAQFLFGAFSAFMTAGFFFYVPFGATAMMRNRCCTAVDGVTRLQLLAFSVAYFVDLGWMCRVVASAWSLIDFWIDSNATNQTVMTSLALDAVSCIFFVVAAIGYDVTYRRIRRHIHHHHHHQNIHQEPSIQDAFPPYQRGPQPGVQPVYGQVPSYQQNYIYAPAPTVIDEKSPPPAYNFISKDTPH